MSRNSQKQLATVSPPMLSKVTPIHSDFSISSIQEIASFSAIQRGRHYLKVMLPAIPVATFILTFLVGYLTEVKNASANNRPIDPSVAMAGAIGLTIVMGLICTIIYMGFRQVTGLTDSRHE